MSTETKKTGAPIAELLKQAALAAEARAAKFMASSADDAPLKPPVEPAGASVEAPAAASADAAAVAMPIAKNLAGRRRGKKKNTGPKLPAGNMKPAVPAAVPVLDAMRPIASGDTADVDDSRVINPFIPRRRGADTIGKAQAAMDQTMAEAAMQPAASAKAEIPVLTDKAITTEIIPESADVALPDQSRDEKPDESLESLRARADEARRQYAREDHDNTNRWLKIRNFFGSGVKQEKSADTEYYQAQYNNALIDLRNAELAGIRRSGLQGTELHEALAGMLTYFKHDELVKLTNERTQVRAEHRGLPGKAMAMMETIGREYNGLSFGKKMLVAGALVGLAGVTGGASLLMRRLLAGAGAAVALEALIEKNSGIRHQAKAEEEAGVQLESLEKNNFWNEKRSHAADVRYLNEMTDADIFSLDEKLQQGKRDALLRKTASLGAGFGGGYFAKEVFDMAHGDELLKGGKELVMERFGGNEAADWIKGQFGETVPGTHIAPVSGNIEMSDVPQAAAEMKTDLISGFVNQDIRIAEGDSVWKIGGGLADQLGLEGAQRTHFVDALKDKFGDVLLQEGETVNLARHGIDREFVETALQDARTLTSAQSIAIEANDARIAEYARANPEVTLTDGVTKNIIEAPSATPDTFGSEALSAETGMPGSGAIGSEGIARGTAPELAALYNARADDWYQQIFRMENASFGQDWMIDRERIGGMKLRDILQDARLFQQGAYSGYTTGLDREQIANFAEFFQNVTTNDIGFDRVAFFRERPNATVMEYLNEVAPLVRQGQRFGLYTTTR